MLFSPKITCLIVLKSHWITTKANSLPYCDTLTDKVKVNYAYSDKRKFGKLQTSRDKKALTSYWKNLHHPSLVRLKPGPITNLNNDSHSNYLISHFGCGNSAVLVATSRLVINIFKKGQIDLGFYRSLKSSHYKSEFVSWPVWLKLFCLGKSQRN